MTYEEMMDSYIKGLVMFVKLENDVDSSALPITELVIEGEISLEKAIHFPEILTVSLIAMSQILKRDLEEDLEHVREVFKA